MNRRILSYGVIAALAAMIMGFALIPPNVAKAPVGMGGAAFIPLGVIPFADVWDAF